MVLLGGLLALASAAQALVCATPGKDGVGTGITGVVNTYYPGTASATAGATTLSLGASQGAATQITAGDLLLVIQMQDATLNTANTNAYGAGTTTASGATAINAGKYEYVVATSASSGGGSVTIRGDGAGGGLLNGYAASAYSASSGAKTFQVIRVPQYSSATLGAALTSPAWNGASGGVVAIDVAGVLNLNGGAITTTGLGFRGGGGRQLAGAAGGTGTDYRNLATNPYHGQKGEGLAGTPRYLNNAGVLLDTTVEGYPNGSSARGAPGNAGGGGTDSNPLANDQNSGGGGGAGGGAGGQGGNAWSSAAAVGGLGGTPVAASVTQVLLGGGGGAGSSNDGTGTPASSFASSGAAGGGAVLVRAGTISGTGSVTANGSSANNTVANDGSGGGGAGGSVLVVSPAALPAGLTVNARGGTGGTNTGGGTPPPHGPGGGGGGGAVVLSGAGPTVSVAGGAAGTTTGGVAFGAVPGSIGSTVTVTAAQVPGAAVTSACLPALSVVKTTGTSNRVISTDTTADYTITLQNTGGGAVGVSAVDVLPAPFAYNGAAITPVYAGGASGPLTLTGTGTTTVTFGTAGGTVANSFSIPTGGSVALSFTVNLGGATPGTYQNPAAVNFSDPTRTGTQTATPGGTYTGGGTVAGSNYASASSTGEDVSVSTAPVTCSSMYVLSGGDYTTGNNGTDIRRIDETTDTFGQLITQIPSTTAGQFGYSATLAVGIGGTKIFAARDQDRALLVYDVATGVWTNAGTLTAGTTVARLVRMTVGPDGTGYVMDGAGSFYTFKQNGAAYTITGPSSITVSPATAPTFGGSGDFFADAQGRLFLLSSPGGVNYLDFFEINPANNTAAYLGRITDPDINNASYGGYAVTANGIYGRSGTGRMIQIDLSNLSVAPIDAAETNTAGSTDLASCYFPSYNRVLTADKTVAKVAGSAGPDVRVGDTLEYTIVIRNSGSLTVGGVTFQDSIPAGTSYVAASTTLNTVAVADAAGVMPFVASGKSVYSPGQADGVLLTDSTPAITTDREATVKFRVTVNAGATSVSNQGTVGYLDGTSKTRQTDDPNTPAANDPTVSVINLPPTTANVTNVVLLNTAAATVLNPNLSATDTDGTIASYTIQTLPSAASGVLSVNGTAVTAGQTFTAAQLGTLTFAPKPGFSGNASFTYSATDNLGATSNTSTYTIPVNNPPTTANVTNVVLLNTAAATVLNPNLSATDTDGTIASYTIQTLPSAASGVLALNGTAVTAGQTFTAAQLGTLTFAPKPGFSGNASFTYRATDNLGAVSNTSTYTIPVNNPPTTVNVTNATLLDTAAATVLNPNLSATDTDGTIASYTIATLPAAASGVLALNGTAVTAGQTFTAAQLNTLTFDPAAGFNGNATFTYSATDNLGAVSNTSTYTIPVNVAPVAASDTGSTPANTAKVFSLTANDTDTAPGTINVASTVFATSGQPAGSTLSGGNRTITVPGEGSYTLDNSGNVTFTPVSGYSGTTTPVKYTVQDNQGATSNVANITVTVTPLAVNDTASTTPSTLVNIPVLTNDLGTGKVLTSVVFPAAGQPSGSIVTNGGKTLTNADGVYTVKIDGAVDFTPALGKTGTLSPVLYTFQDAAGQTSNPATITVTVGNITPPTATNDSKTTPKNTPVTLEGSTNDTAGSLPIDNASVVLTAGGTISNGGKTLTNAQGTYQVQANGTVIFTPVSTFAGTTTPVSYTVKDTSGATSNAATLSVIVTNQPPVANNVTNTLLTSTAPATALNPGVSGTDPDGAVVTYTVTTLPTAAMGTLYCNGAAIASVPSTCVPAQLSFKPNPAYNGNATFQYAVTDDNGATSAAATYTIPVNKPPVATNDSAATNPNVSVTFSVTGNDTDTAPGTVDVTTTTFDPSSTGTISNAGKTLTVAGEGVYTFDNTGKVTFVPAVGFNNGVSTAKYTVKDNQGAVSNVATITVSVPANVDLAITKVGPGYFKPGDSLSYTLTVTNTGSAATGVTVTDTLPTGLTFVSASGGGSYNAGTGKVSWTVGNLANGATVTLTLTGTAPSAASVETNNGPTSLVNTATTAANETELVTTNNTASSSAQLVYPKLSKRVRNVTQSGAFGTVGSGKPGEVLEYCIDFKNYGVSVASFVITDTVPGNTTADLSAYGAGLGLQVVRGSTSTRTSTGSDGDGGSLSASSLSLDLGTLAAGESGSVCFRASIK
ncbi:tandem-95 repeat protein [Deinococcus sp.]|uniref:tandem-95 repeat protein n=1 Tax=Deinococcus sp. TaxID=47478 RepID=UPI003C797FA4